MFKPQTTRINEVANNYRVRIAALEQLFFGTVNIYVDYANVRPWATKLGWNIDLRRLKQFLYSFNNVASVKFYSGLLLGDIDSEDLDEECKKLFKDDYKTKSVKILKKSIDYSSIKSNSSDLLEQFVRKCLLREYTLDTIEYLNERFRDLNQIGKLFIEDRKCNFDVEIGTDMALDLERKGVDTFVLWSGDSDFYDPVLKLLEKGKRVILFATARKVSSELNDLGQKGLCIYDIQKIRNFICYKRQIDLSL